MHTDMERAFARMALVPLENDHKFTHKSAQLRKWFSKTVLAEIADQTKTARSYNKDMSSSIAIATLTPNATAYWSEVQKVLQRGKRAQQAGNHTDEKAVGLASERLCERFEELVPDVDKPKFHKFDPLRHAETWDDRWSFVEFYPPLLMAQFIGELRIDSPVNYAQRLVLETIGQPDFEPEVQEANLEQSRNLRELAIRLAAGKARKPKRTSSKTVKQIEAEKVTKMKKDNEKAMGIKRTKFRALKRLDDLIEIPEWGASK